MTDKTRPGGGGPRKTRTSAGGKRPRPAHLTGLPSVDVDRDGRLGAHNMTFARVVDQVTDAGLTQKELGVAVGASLRTVQNWASGDSAPRGLNQQRLLELKYIVEELSVVYTDEAIEIWFRARNRNLGGNSPLDLLANGNIDDVRREAERISGGM